MVYFVGRLRSLPQVAELPLSFRSLVAEFDSRLGCMLPPEKADAMRTALAFVWAVQREQWGDAGEMLKAMLDTSHESDPVKNFSNAMGVMATLLCNELDITEEWVQARVRAINYLETHPDA
jgi:hypothetical protein